MLFVIYVLDLKALSQENRLIKYADDTTLLVAENSPVDLATEFSHIEEWSKDNKLIINKNKTEEIVLRRSKIRHFLTPPPLSGICQVDEVKLLGVYLTNSSHFLRYFFFTFGIIVCTCLLYTSPSPRD